MNGVAKKITTGILTVVLTMNSAILHNVSAHEQEGKDIYSIMPTSTVVEQCGNCGVGTIYSDYITINKTFQDSVKCEHGFTRGTDAIYKYDNAFVYKCNVCGYGWTEYTTRYETVCEGYNSSN